MRDSRIEPLAFEDFVDRQDEVFTVAEPDAPAIPLTLVAAETLPARHGLLDGRPAFSLMFLGKDARVLPQKLYRLEHGVLGGLVIFLVPVGKDARGVRYQATFN